MAIATPARAGIWLTFSEIPRDHRDEARSAVFSAFAHESNCTVEDRDHGEVLGFLVAWDGEPRRVTADECGAMLTPLLQFVQHE